MNSAKSREDSLSDKEANLEKTLLNEAFKSGDRISKFFFDLKGNITPSQTEIEFVEKEIVTLESIIKTLQRENEVFFTEKKKLQQRIKDLERISTNLEAKLSIQRSAQSNSDGLPDKKDDTIKALHKTIRELTEALTEADNIKCAMQNLVKTHPQSAANMDSTNLSQTNKCEKSAAQAYQYRLIDQLKGRLKVQSEEIAYLKEKYEAMEKKLLAELDILMNRIRQNSESQVSVQQTDTSVPANDNTIQKACDHSIYEKTIQNLEDSLIEKTKLADAAVNNLNTETAKIRAYYEEAIKSIISDSRKCANQHSIDKDSALKVAQDKALESEVLKKRVSELEEVNRNSVSKELHNSLVQKLDDLSLQLQETKKENVLLQVQLGKKEEELAIHQRESKQELLSQLEAQYKKHNSNLNKIQELHDVELKRIAKSTSRKNFNQEIKKKWLSLKRDHPEQFISSVIERIAFLENYCAQKDAEMELNLTRIIRVAEMESRIQKQKADLLVEEKNIQIKQFQFQLDSLLKTVSQLKKK